LGLGVRFRLGLGFGLGARLGLGLALGFGFHFAFLVFRFALRELGGSLLLGLLRFLARPFALGGRFRACLGFRLALRLALLEFFLFPRQLELELFLLLGKLGARFGLLARRVLGF